MQGRRTISSVTQNRGFLNLWLNQILVQLSYNSLNFALIIWVFRLTGSTTANAGLLTAVYLPAVIFGLFAGVLVDISDRRQIIRVINILLALGFLSLIFLKSYYPAILFVVFFVNTLAQFYVPAESSAIPIVVKKGQLLIANSLFSTTLYLSFLIGFGLAGPLINHLGIDMVFGVGGALLLLAFLLSFFFPPIIGKSSAEGQTLIKAIKRRNMAVVGQVGTLEIKKTLKLIRGKLSVLSSVVILTGVQVVIGILAVLIPGFLEKTLRISATDASYVLVIPLGVGMVIGGFLVGKLGHLFPRRRIVGAAVVFAGAMFLLVGLAPVISPVIHYLKPGPLPFFYQWPLSRILVVGSFLLGMAMVSIIVPSQTVLQESTPEESRGKVFSVLSVAMSGLSLIPVILSGVLADFFGVMPIFIALGLLTLIVGIFTLKPSVFFAEKHLSFEIREFLGLDHWKK